MICLHLLLSFTTSYHLWHNHASLGLGVRGQFSVLKIFIAKSCLHDMSFHSHNVTQPAQSHGRQESAMHADVHTHVGGEECAEHAARSAGEVQHPKAFAPLQWSVQVGDQALPAGNHKCKTCRVAIGAVGPGQLRQARWLARAIISCRNADMMLQE